MTIWKFPLEVIEAQTVKIPVGANAPVVLDVQWQGDSPVMWVLLDPNEAMTDITVRCFGTGGPIPEGDGIYLGTVQNPKAPFVWHFFCDFMEEEVAVGG